MRFFVFVAGGWLVFMFNVHVSLNYFSTHDAFFAIDAHIPALSAKLQLSDAFSTSNFVHAQNSTKTISGVNYCRFRHLFKQLNVAKICEIFKKQLTKMANSAKKVKLNIGAVFHTKKHIAVFIKCISVPKTAHDSLKKAKSSFINFLSSLCVMQNDTCQKFDTFAHRHTPISSRLFRLLSPSKIKFAAEKADFDERISPFSFLQAVGDGPQALVNFPRFKILTTFSMHEAAEKGTFSLSDAQRHNLFTVLKLGLRLWCALRMLFLARDFAALASRI